MVRYNEAMKSYFFVLGTNHTLSKIDIVNVLAKKEVDFEIIEASEEILVVQTETELETEKLINELGSAAKIGEIFNCYPLTDFPENFVHEFVLPEVTENARFGLSVYNGGGGFKNLNQVWFLAPKIGREIKEKFGLGYLPVKERELSSVTVDKNNLLKEGFELVLIVGRQGVYAARTLAIQDYESYSARDYGRPARDAESGMIPPKLAKMMINLAGKEKSDLFLDPFCGSGTMLQELILLGYNHLIGTDSSAKSIADTQANLDWLLSKYRLKLEDYQIKLEQGDVAKLSAKVNYKTVFAIVTEPYLGSPKARFFRPEEIKKEISKLSELYLKAFAEFRKVLKDNGVIVIIFPVFRVGSQFFYLEILKEIQALGFKKREYLFQKPVGFEYLNLNLNSREAAVFFRPGQTISREIFVFQVLQSSK